MDAQHFATGAYIVLLFALVFFVALSAVLIFFLKKELGRSLGREKEGAAWSRAALLAQGDERARISRELHDTVAQDLRYLSLEVGKIGNIGETAARKKRCDDAAKLLLELGRRVRATCDYLVPPNFRFRGLPDALRHLCLDFGRRTGIECGADIIGDSASGSFDAKKQLQVFRIMQEALVNVERHAKAAKVTVVYHRDADGSVHADVFDDGAGFDLRGFAPPGNAARNPAMTKMGIRGVKERAAFLNAELEISSEPGEGTSLCLVIPRDQGVASCLEGTGRFTVCAQVTTFAVAKRHIEEAGERQPSLVILDIILGEENGLDFLPFLEGHCNRNGLRKPFALVCSVLEEPFRIQSAAIKLGVSGYVSKAEGEAELLAAIDAVLRNDVYLSEKAPRQGAAKPRGLREAQQARD